MVRQAVTPPATIRCAIYTRKSSEEGLEQDFNSLDAQREACEACITSQRHEGWQLVPHMYDDGGISGGTMDRPALQHLLQDITTGLIDTIVVYKVDRLTRSLADFAKIVDVFDAHKASFVSVTQSFNTTTSMGRLTLNMLLSFAQFEREVTGERIRDKIAASKKKGMWMGGTVPLGYETKDRKLLVHETEAETVRHIFHRYSELGSVSALQAELADRHIVSKQRTDRHGRMTGGLPLARGALYHMLSNRLYRGEIVHKGQCYPGEHDAIINEDLWQQVQDKLELNRQNRASGTDVPAPSLLAGFLYDEGGDRMTPSHASRKGVRYRYYISRRLIIRGRHPASGGRRVPAGDLEGLVETRVQQFLTSKTDVMDAMAAGGLQSIAAHECDELFNRARTLAEGWTSQTPAQRRSMLTTLINRVTLFPDRLELHLSPEGLKAILEKRPEEIYRPHSVPADKHHVTLIINARLRRTGIETRLLIEGQDASARRKPDHSLHRLMAQAHMYQALILRGRGDTITELATEAGVSPSYFTRILKLSFLSPEILADILRDRHPLHLTAKRLANEIKLPVAWEKQRKLI